MHLHQHLSKCILDFGPVYSFWLYSFERYNGILGNYTTNQKSVEIQIMRKFLNEMHIKSLALSAIEQDNIEIFSPFFAERSKGSSATIDWQSSAWHSQLSLPTSTIEPSMHNTFLDFIQCLPPFKRRLFDRDSLRYLKESYISFLPVELSNIPASYEICDAVTLWGTKIGSEKSRNEKSSYIQAYWSGRSGEIDMSCSELYTGHVQFFFRQNIQIECGERLNIVIACVKWFQRHPRQNMFGAPVEVWTAAMHESFGPASFIPVNRINNLCVVCPLTVERENVLVVTPLKRKVYL